MGSSRSEVAGKERLKWTQELHDLFEKSVNQLGGPDRATPKGILKTMGIPGLTIYHVKSHLQKYRISQFVPETPNKSKFERRNISEILPNFSATAGAQLNEALKMQVEVQKRLSDQVEVQRNLKVKIEAQGRFLIKIGEEHKNRPNINAKPSKSFSPISLPSLCEECESDNKEPAESDSEVEIYDTRSSETFQKSKRLRVDQREASPQRHKKFTSESCAQHRMFVSKGSRTQCESPEFGFPWNAAVYCQSPLMPASYGVLLVSHELDPGC
ncbi:Octamer-binding transcription factor [Heracleum sosnowskyi]|uniref:Octamer-binding transcription factor n=1 Tax=Heracleum sosnowskyi TaxID=360622 RepID=A0AAD8M166_9APIA|nr:Octamer-binding transcription factor [Heracleum sosnowskyi]